MIHRPMSKKTALALFTIADLIGIVGLWMGYDTISEVFNGIDGRADIIEFINGTGFLTFGIFVIIIHICGIIEYFYPKLITKNLIAANAIGLGLLIAFFVTGFSISTWIKYNVVNSGYSYCSRASGSGVFRALVYTKTMDICEQETQKKTFQSDLANDLRQ